MSISPATLQELILEVEAEDPIDFADLPYDEDELRELVANHLCEMAERMDAFSPEERHLCLLAVAAKLVLENMVLHIRLLRDHPQTDSHLTQELLARLRRGKDDGQE